MQNPRRFSLTRQVLFPYTGEHALSVKQGLRVVLAWALLFPLPVSLLVLLLTLAEGYSAHGIVNSVLFAFLSGVFVFGILSLLIVMMSNRAAHIRQAWKARNGQS
jgi:hypothetical protein